MPARVVVRFAAKIFLATDCTMATPAASFVPALSPEGPTVADLNPLLLDAKNIYVNQLAEALGPYILRTIEALYAETTEAGSSKVLMRFQAKLRQVPLWNSALTEQHAAALQAKVPYLSDLIAAAFVAYVKVMSSIKLRADKPNIRLKLPTNAAFVHKAFINVARDFYAAPQMGQSPAGMYTGMRTAIERTIRDMLPIRDILKAYLGNTVDDATHTVSPTLDDDAHAEEAEDADSPAMFDDSPSPMPVAAADPIAPAAAPPLYPQHPQPLQPQPQPLQPQPYPQAPAVLQPAQPQPAVAQVTECQTKTISIPPAKDDDDMFSDADDAETDWKGA